jgi:hypothetical protein
MKLLDKFVILNSINYITIIIKKKLKARKNIVGQETS